MSQTNTYTYDNAHPSAAVQHHALSTLLDPVSTTRIEAAMADLDGAQCLEVGAGGSGVPVWLAGRVGSTGSVTATDLHPQHLHADPRIQALTHNIVTDPLPLDGYDLIHARLLLMHLPTRLDVLAKLTAALTPGEVLCIEDWLLWPDHAVLAAATPQAAELFARYQRAVVDMFTSNGADATWATRTHTAMRDAGLVDVHTSIDAPVWQAGGLGLTLVAVNLAQHRDRLHQAGLDDDELDEIAAMAADPTSGLVVRGHLLYSTTGRRPTSQLGSVLRRRAGRAGPTEPGSRFPASGGHRPVSCASVREA